MIKTMNSLIKIRSSAARLISSFHLLRSYSPPAGVQQPVTLEPFDPRKLPTDYNPSTFDPSNHRAPPTPRVWRLVDDVSSLTQAEIVELCQIIIERDGLKDPPMVAVMGAGGGGVSAAGKGGAAAGPAKEEEKKEKTVFELKLESFDAASKIKVIKEVRAFTDLGLKEAKELVEKAPVVIKGGISKEDGAAIVEKLKAVGAKVVLE